jgi:hypothetical protein
VIVPWTTRINALQSILRLIESTACPLTAPVEKTFQLPEFSVPIQPRAIIKTKPFFGLARKNGVHLHRSGERNAG